MIQSHRWPSIAILSITILIFAIFSTRGLDFTDESYYLLNYLHWRDLSATTTLFGAYLEPLFRIAGENLAIMRIFGLASLCYASYFFIERFLTYSSKVTQTSISERFPIILGSISSGILYYSFFDTLRLPSYNLISLFCILISTGIVFSHISRDLGSRSNFNLSIIYGLIISVLIFNKATSALATVVVHIIIFVAHYGKHSFRELSLIIPGTALGLIVNLVFITLNDLSWLNKLTNGLELSNSLDNRDNILLNSFTHLRWEVQKHIAQHWLAYLLLFSIHILIVINARSKYLKIIDLWVFLFVLALVALIINSDREAIWIPQIAFSSFILWSTELFLNKQKLLKRHNLNLIGLLAILIALSLAFSWGTNMPLLVHSKMAVVLPIAGLFLILARLHSLGIIGNANYRAISFLMCLPAFVFTVQPWWDVEHTYRLQASLSQQNTELTIKGHSSAVLVDTETSEEINQLRKLLGKYGFSPGKSILDLTGTAPGLIYVTGGKPLVVAWLLGGYEGSSNMARKTIKLADAKQWKCAWLFTSDNSARRIVDWRQIMENEYNVFNHLKVGQTTMRPFSKWGKENPKLMTVEVWRPRQPDCI